MLAVGFKIKRINDISDGEKNLKNEIILRCYLVFHL